MNLEQAKFEISQKLLQLKKLLQYRDIEIMRDEESQKDVICFNGWLTIEGFQQSIKYDTYLELDSLIHLCYLNELSEEKRNLLVESIIEDLQLNEPINTFNYDVVSRKLNIEQLEVLHEFEALQGVLIDNLILSLTEKYLSKVPLDKSKIARLVWNGNQLQLAELFLQLELKGWISPVANKAAYFRTLGTVFEVKESDKLIDNISDYFKKKKVSRHGIFKTVANNDIK